MCGHGSSIGFVFKDVLYGMTSTGYAEQNKTKHNSIKSSKQKLNERRVLVSYVRWSCTTTCWEVFQQHRWCCWPIWNIWRWVRTRLPQFQHTPSSVSLSCSSWISTAPTSWPPSTPVRSGSHFKLLTFLISFPVSVVSCPAVSSDFKPSSNSDNGNLDGAFWIFLDTWRETKRVELNWTELNWTGAIWFNSANRDLQSIQLVNCKKLSSLPDHVFTHSANLRHLSLRDNGLQSVSSQMAPWSQLDMVDFTGNPFNCKCDLIWLRNYLREMSSSAAVRTALLTSALG